ncbi:MAG: hypothetical protein N3B16_03490 [Candidatus Aminicenantes bacterium]|nr:hypothetical protein [Candidatus Aminicenantes bacterium]
MSQCYHCQRRKAKRHCSALRAELCQLCCGELRQKKINCPPSCPYLQHQTYQEQRKWQKLRNGSKEILKDERLAWLAAQIELAVNQLAQQQIITKDYDAFKLLNYARDKIAVSDKIIVLPAETINKKNSPEEALVNFINNVRYEKGLMLSVTSSGYKREEKLKCLEALMAILYEITKGDLSGRIYLEDLARRAEKAQKEKGQKILLP